MTLYRVNFLDHTGNVYSTQRVEHDDDAAAIAASHCLNVLPHLGSFEVWDDDRLVYRYQK